MLYFGPETIMPLGSALAAVMGVILLFWQRTVGYVRRIVTRARERFGGTGR